MKLHKYEVHYSFDGTKRYRVVRAANEFGALAKVEKLEDGRHVIFDAVLDSRGRQLLYREQL